MKTVLLALTFVVITAQAQISSSYQWTWIGGDNVPNIYGVYGQKGVENSTNKPGSRAWASNWTDAAGNLWLFGGYGYAASAVGDLNDLWKYNVNTNRWTWMAGDSIANSGDKHGALGEEGSGYTPAAREGASAWADATGKNLYLFGGWRPAANGQILGDVWSFSTISSKWRWVKSTIVDSDGNCMGQAYGSAGEFTSGVWPVCRAGATAASGGNTAYMFSGGPYTFLNDLYQFADINHTPANQWAYLYFSSEYNYPGKYTGSNPRPGGRRGALSFVAQEGLEYKYYVFGGLGYGYGTSGIQFGRFNDLWRYDGLDQITQKPVWTWVKGDSTVNGSGNYGTFGVTSSTNNPPAKGEGSLTPAGNGQFILFGGYNSSGYYTNDVWSYKVNSKTWTWIGGNNFQNSYGNYGIKDVQQSSNMISARVGHVSWIIPNGDMYVFGGFFTGYNNDLWKFSAPKNLISISSVSNNTVCAGSQFTVTYKIYPQASNPYDDNNYFIAQLSDTSGQFTHSLNVGAIQSKNSGNITVTIPFSKTPGTNYKIRVYSTSPVYYSQPFSTPIVINTSPDKPIILSNDSDNSICPGKQVTLTSSITANSYLWSTGATTKSIKTKTKGAYTVAVIKGNGCKNISDPVTINTLPCAHPTNLLVKNITSTSAKLRWDVTNCAAKYKVQIKHVGETNWHIYTGIKLNSITITNLLPDKNYKWQVKTICDSISSTTSDFITGPEFKTAPSFTVGDNIVTNLKVNEKVNVSLIPNPAQTSAELIIEGDIKNATIIITDMTGKILWQKNNVADRNTKLPIGNFANGTYMVSIKATDYTKTIKLIKQQ
jgi:hypothetical protein